jgi:cyclic-di-AMP phosphodiesterase PgpH
MKHLISHSRFLKTVKNKRQLLLHSGSITALLILLVMLFPASHQVRLVHYKIGDYWIDEDLTAPFTFSIYRPSEEIKRDETTAVKQLPPSFLMNRSARQLSLDTIQRSLASLNQAWTQLSYASTFSAMENAIARMIDSISIRQESVFSLKTRNTLFHALLAEKQRGAGTAVLRETEQTLLKIMKAVYSAGYMNRTKAELHQTHIYLAENKNAEEKLTPLSSFLDIQDVKSFYQRISGLGSKPVRELLRAMQEDVVSVLLPNVVYDSDRTRLAVQDVMNRIPRTIGIIRENDRIIHRNEIITSAIKLKLDSFYKGLQERSDLKSTILQRIGTIGYICLILFLPVGFIVLYRRNLLSDSARLLLLILIIAVVAIQAHYSVHIDTGLPIQYLILFSVASMLLTIVFDSSLALSFTVANAILAAAIRGNDYTIIVAALVTGTLAIYSVRDIKSRTQIFSSILYILVGYLLAIAVEALQRSTALSAVLTEIGFAFVNAILSSFLTFGLLILIEKTFKITTDLRLVELVNTNNPFLVEFSKKAPGTYYHSIALSQLVEVAANAIGANTILAKVGALYHDIGKMYAPSFFTENQTKEERTIHDDIDPKESARRIISHVHEGVRIAREHRLPDHVISFILEHHGTGIVGYFFEKERALHPAGAEMTDFQYPGPKPASKESGILMLADVIEAAARSIDEPTIEKIQKMVDLVVQRRIIEGQLDECQLTLKDLSTVKASFVSGLTATHHARIKYLTQEEAEAAKRHAERTAKLLHLPAGEDALKERLKKSEAS